MNYPDLNLTNRTISSSFKNFVQVTGSVLTNGIGNSFFDLSSSISSSFSSQSISSSFAVSASWAPFVYNPNAISASWASSSLVAISSSWANNSLTSSTMPYSSSTNSITPLVQTGSMYFQISGSNRLLYIYDGIKWCSSSMT